MKNGQYRNRSCLNMWVAPGCKDYSSLSWEDRARITQLYFPAFKPTKLKSKKSKTYSLEWWKKLTGDEQGTAFWTAMFPERTRKDWVAAEVTLPIDFYTRVTADNALAWYLSCPLHLRKQIDARLASLPIAEEAPKEGAIYKQVAVLWGDRPTLRHEEDVHTACWLEEWIYAYEQLTKVEVILQMAPELQKERKMLSLALGLGQDADGFPAQSVGLEDTQAATVRWIQQTGQTPLEFLADTYRDDANRPGDRIAAARAMLDFVHRKVPVKTEVETKEITEPKLNAEILKGLNDKELSLLQDLLTKLQVKANK